jgi:hypothetical protein
MTHQTQTVTIPEGVGYYVEYNGNLTGSFYRATEVMTGKFEQEYKQNVIFKLADGKRAMTRKDLVQLG